MIADWIIRSSGIVLILLRERLSKDALWCDSGDLCAIEGYVGAIDRENVIERQICDSSQCDARLATFPVPY
ncbi:hypothetical protein D3873_03105 [Paenisporosarcina cavernae]|uniref:Uncharacterized protein n=1 Tax=Paenisporosarcina cavernae TaxID=2320858 RepID=A0A385YQ96_9BACL|nr:hypothetical protein D3873_03105 [Paenisporosarcina cavernae]